MTNKQILMNAIKEIVKEELTKVVNFSENQNFEDISIKVKDILKDNVKDITNEDRFIKVVVKKDKLSSEQHNALKNLAKKVTIFPGHSDFIWIWYDDKRMIIDGKYNP